MTIHNFDIASGYYAFNESDLVSQLHAHPAWEFIFAKEGSFSLSLGDTIYENLLFAIIQPNVNHALLAAGCNCDFILIEPFHAGLTQLKEALAEVINSNGIAVLQDNLLAEKLITLLQQMRRHSEPIPVYDERVELCIRFIQDHIADAQVSRAQLARLVYLSPGRLSHLFKTEVGLPIQKFIIWTRIKVVIDHVIKEDLTLTESAHIGGFYDSAHFSRYFKEIFGLPPSSVYNNSRIVQVSD